MKIVKNNQRLTNEYILLPSTIHIYDLKHNQLLTRIKKSFILIVLKLLTGFMVLNMKYQNSEAAKDVFRQTK